MKFEQLEYTLPEWILPYIVNGDATALNDDEQTLADDFLSAVSEHGVGHWQVNTEHSDTFGYNDIDHFLGTTYSATYNYTPHDEQKSN